MRQTEGNPEYLSESIDVGGADWSGEPWLSSDNVMGMKASKLEQ